MTINLFAEPDNSQLNQIEWDILTAIISQFAYFEFNKKRLTCGSFLGRTNELQAEFSKIEAYIDHFTYDNSQIIKHLFSNLPSDDSLIKYIEYLSKQGTLNFGELNKLALMAEAAIYIKKEIPSLSVQEIQLIHLLDFQHLQRNFLKEFRHLVDSNGEVHFERHPELSDLKKKLQDLEDRLRRSIQEWINQPSNLKILQYSSYDVHYDRFVVPVRSDSYRSEIGLIVTRSETGHTLFVEPFEIRELCNKRIELMAKIDEIINQITLRFSRQLSEYSVLLKNISTYFIDIDFYLAKINFTEKYALECPRIRSTPGFKFSALFHPLINKPVKNDVDCGESVHGIVISGPNTGGKTVFLKAITLSYLLFNHGFYVPAKDAELFPYDGIFYFGNDLQDLKVGLSSFSGEVENYLKLIGNLTPTNLILIDEIFNSTSSDEASALSLAYFRELHKRAKCHIIVSTHHQMFKTLIHQDEQYLSCHVGFDTTLFRPTYKIIWGTPGASMAIEIFKIISKNQADLNSIAENAGLLLNDKNISYETLLQKVTQKQIEVERLIESNKKIESDLKNQKGAMEGVLHLKLNEELNKAKKEVDRILNEAKLIVEESRKNNQIKIKTIESYSHQFKNEITNIAGDSPVAGPSLPFNSDIDINSLSPGDIVYSIVLNKEFTVVAFDKRKQECSIAKGPIKITVPLNTLIKQNKYKAKNTVKVHVEKSSNSSFEYDVRGMRLSEFQNILDKALGDLLSGDIPFLTIIHGHGDGILKNWLRGYLKNSKDFTMTSNESGNDGETRIAIK